ncbi:MAG TPA: ABC transporter permease [Thermoplasmata archaeon]|nr:ABC transporter permease [Thermoplasmata archaeon]
MGRDPSNLILFIGKRALQLVPVIIGIVLVTFYLTHVAIADPCSLYVGPHADASAHRACISSLGLNQPLPSQFAHYADTLLTGNWGTDPYTSQPVAPQIAQDVPATFELVLTALLMIILLGVPLGVIAANSSGRWPDHLVRIFYLSGWALPTYLLGLLLAIFVAPALGLTLGPFSTDVPPFPQPTHMSVVDAALAGNPTYVGDALAHLILPAFALALLNLGIVTRMTRSAMLEVLPLDYVKTARMKGLSEFFVLYKHALRNSLITTTTVLGVTAGTLLSGTVIIESIFRWPGIGQYALSAIVNANFPGVIATVVVFGIGVVIANLIADVAYGILDPRVEWR